jgi:hypothetical protein
MVIGLAEMLAAAYLWRAFGRLAAQTERIIAAVAILTQAVQAEAQSLDGGIRESGSASTGAILP